MEEQKKRYTDEELEEFRQIILAKLELAKRDYQLLMDELTNKNDNGAGSHRHIPLRRQWRIASCNACLAGQSHES